MSDLQRAEIVAVCPDCGSEFQSRVTRCIDCGAPTKSFWTADLHRLQREEEVAAFGLSLPRDSPASVIRVADLEWAKRLGSFLERRGVPSRIEVHDFSEYPLRYSVCVAEADVERAFELDREHMRIEVPGAAFTELPPADECPACGSRVSLDEAECPSCGLVLDGPEEP